MNLLFRREFAGSVPTVSSLLPVLVVIILSVSQVAPIGRIKLERYWAKNSKFEGRGEIHFARGDRRIHRVKGSVFSRTTSLRIG